MRADRRAGRGEGFVTHWGRKVLEVRPPVRLDKGRGIEHAARRRRPRRGALRRATTAPTSTPSRGLRRLVAEGRLGSALCVGVRSDETPAELRARPTCIVDGTRGVRQVLEALAA